MLGPRQVFEDNIRPADLLLKVFRLLENDSPNMEESIHTTLRNLVKADQDEGLIVIYNEVFLGLIRERADVPISAIKRSTLTNLLRQSVVTVSTALETYLPSLLRENLHEVIGATGRAFIPKKDEEIKNQFKNLAFSLEEVARILEDPDPIFVANKMISSLNFSYLSGKRGIHVVGVLLGLENPWGLIANHLGRSEEEIRKTLDSAISRRNDIVHRADRSQKAPEGPAQEMTYPWAKQAVETIRVVCLTLDDLVASSIRKLKSKADNFQS